ncbi:GNAT family N-acetyltransferase [Aliiroseovarius lamellibrachiae]|uniref:GNAT family N-acetyltransferase n=1 Tax=Aliiroseovarius lamellibrachiae TaxID=1924933 RepID=UPI001BE01D90|nr:GNAT family N-acetyltransferase [Aliiroseovarius lamellibrachiae]MBT2131822.1 GNAT family N-acetyltransferase [Aliiroseovarius lamellibrachiae]
MTQSDSNQILTGTAETVQKHGFFCKMSARKTSAWKRKKAWLEARFSEGLQLRLLGNKERGFIEFIPGKYAWRGIENADEFVVIHCLWVVGKSKGHGFSTQLLTEAEDWARENGYKGVAALTSSGNWLIDKGILDHHGYQSVDSAAPGYDLMLKSLSPSDPPQLSGHWHAKAAAYGSGVTVLHSAQCPYLEDAVTHARAAADTLGLSFRAIEITSATDARTLVPNPYGVFSLIHDGREISSHYLLTKQILPLIDRD